MKKLFFLLIFLLQISFSSFSQVQTCPASNNQWQWPTHSRWFFGKQKQLNFGSNGMTAPVVSNLTANFDTYEGVSSACDESGNIVCYTNGVYLWDAVGTQVAVPGGRLKAGSETANGTSSSAVQGVMIVKHPLNTDEYYIFTTDDAISGMAGVNLTYGFNYAIYNKTTNTCTAPVRLGNYRTTEQLAATWHSNGIDIWVCTHESTAGGTTKYNAYLLKCNGLDLVNSPKSSNVGFVAKQSANNSNERSSLRFSWDGTKAAATFHCGDGTWDPLNAVSIMNFNNTTGLFSNAVGINTNDAAHSNPYCCEFSPSGNRLYVTYMCDNWSAISGKVGYFNLAGNAYTNVANLGNSVHGGTVKLGGDGRMYVGGFQDPWAYNNNIGVISNPDGAATYNANGISPGAGTVSYGLSNMFIPPQDYLKINDNNITTCQLPLDIGVTWKCKVTDAEDLTISGWSTVLPAQNAYINPITGVLAANTPVGVYEVIYKICTISDTGKITITSCTCPIDLKNENPDICIGEQVKLDTTVLGGPGIWSIDSVPTTAGTNPTLVISAGDTLFTTIAGNKPGTYKILFKDAANATCRDSIYITINPSPTPSITAFGPLCNDSLLTTMTLTSAIVGGTGQWYINNVASTDQYDPSTPAFSGGTTTRTDTVKYTHTDANGCIGTDKKAVVVNKRKDATFTTAGPFCMNAAKTQLTFPATSTSGGVWSGGAFVNSTGMFDPSKAAPGNNKVYYTLGGICGDQTSQDIIAMPVFTSVITQDKTLCPNQTYTLTNTWLPVDPATMGYIVPATWKFVGPGSGLNAATGLFDASVAGVGQFKITYEVTGYNCIIPDTVTMDDVAFPAATITGDSTVCENIAGVQLTSSNNIGTWWDAQGKINTATGFFTAAGTAVGNYPIEYRMDNGACKDTVKYNIRVKKVPKTDFVGVNLIGCVVLNVNYTDLSDSVPIATVWSFSGIVVTSIGSTTYLYNTPGIYPVSLTNTYKNGCIGIEIKKDYVTAIGWPKADFTTTPDLISTTNPVATFYDASSDDVTQWKWDFTAKGTPLTATTPIQSVEFNSTDDDTIPVKLWVSNGYCADSIVKDVYVKSNTTIFVPTAFTPNNDGDNDSFKPEGYNFGDKGYEFMVFDRWGEVIFKTNDSTEGWKGKRDNNKRDAQIDVYVWRVTYVDHFSGIKQKPIVGHVTLLR